MEVENLIETFSEFKEVKNIDRETMMNILEDVFKAVLAKKYDDEGNFDVIINVDKGDLEIWKNREVVEDNKLENPIAQIALSEALKIEDDYEVGEEVSEQVSFESEFGRRQVLSIRQHLMSRIADQHRDELMKRYEDRIGEIIHGEKMLDKMGLKNKRFVCLMNRDEEYLKTNFSKDYSHHSYRNSNIKNYLEAANFLADQNIFVLRMGKSTDQKIEKKCDYIFDYANSSLRSDFLDLYLPYKCFFWLSGDAGLQLTSKVYRKPIVSVNRAPFFQNNWSGISKKKNITIFKKYYDKNDNKYLSISEIKKKNVGYFQNTLDYEKSNIYLEENSPDEIFLATKQMYEILNNKFEKKEQYKIIEKQFWKLYGIDNFNDEIVSDICYEFFNKNDYLLN